MMRFKISLVLPIPLLWPAAFAAGPDMPRARWIDNGLIDGGGTHEPYLFVVRRGGQSLAAREHLKQAESEALLRRLKQQGVEVFHTHLYKGFGMEAERPEMEETRRVTQMAHGMGLKVDTYIQWNTMMYETFFAEEPRAKDWIQRDAAGTPIMLTYGFQQSFRYRPCFANQEYLDYLKKIVRFAVEEVKTDFIHFDNFDLNPEPESCHDQTCVRGFRNYLKAKYSPAQRKERFGFENIDYVNPPMWNRTNQPANLRIIFDPAIQEWIDYRCQVMADALRQMALYAKSLNPEVVIEVNPHGINGANRTWQAAIDHSRILKSTEVFWTEEENQPTYTADKRLVSKIRSYKLARTYGNVLLTYIAEDPVGMAESLAFNQTFGYAGNDPVGPKTLDYVKFYRNNRDLFTGARDLATVAVLRSYPSLTYNHADTQLSTILAEQALIQSRIPFDLIFDEHLASLSKYEVLVLPNTECLSDAQLSSIRKFVASGGGLVATGQAGLYDQWRRLRVEPGLKELIDAQPRARDYEENAAPVEVRGAPTRKQSGAGRVVYLPGFEFDGPMPETEPYFTIGDRYWKLPRNSGELIEGIRWAAATPMPVDIKGPEYLVANTTIQPDRRRMLVHLVNYDAARTPSIDGIQVKLRLPDNQSAKEVLVYSPETAAAEHIRPAGAANELSFAVPRLRTYSVIAVRW
jgi:hypothetical protein